MPTEIAGKKLYTLKEVAAGVGVHYQTVKGWVSDGTLHANKMGKSYRVTEEELNRLIEGEPSTNGSASK
jgi:excisionase family DNA binding protein